MPSGTVLAAAGELAATNTVAFPNESEAYRKARQLLLAEEIELRRRIERVAEMRRALPPGGVVAEDYEFEGEDGRVSFGDLFGDKSTLMIYSYMFGPERVRPCPMCTALLGSWDGAARNITQKIALAVVARSHVTRTCRG